MGEETFDQQVLGGPFPFEHAEAGPVESPRGGGPGGERVGPVDPGGTTYLMYSIGYPQHGLAGVGRDSKASQPSQNR